MSELGGRGYDLPGDKARKVGGVLDNDANNQYREPFYANLIVGDPYADDAKVLVVPGVMAKGLAAIAAELKRAMKKFPDNSVFRNRHEGYGIVLEEIAEAIQVGAMVLHYIKDFGGSND